MMKINFLGLILLSSIVCCYGLPYKLTDPSNNIPDPPVVNQSDPLYNGFLEFSEMLMKSQEFQKYNPCDNFYEYVCDKNPVYSVMGELQKVNKALLVSAMKREQKTKFGKKIKSAFDACVAKTKNHLLVHKNGQAVVDLVNKVAQSINVPFPVFSQQSIASTPEDLSSALGYLSLNFDVKSLIGYEIIGPKVMFNAPELTYPEVYYQEHFKEFKKGYVASIADHIILFAEYSGKNLDKKVLMNDINEVVELEKAIADAVKTEKNDNQKIDSVVLTASKLHEATNFINIGTYLQAISPNPVPSFTDHPFPIYVKNPAKLAKLQNFFGTNQVDHRVIYNMIYFKLLRSLKNLFSQKPVESVADNWLRQGFGLEQNGFFPPQPAEDFHPSELTDPSHVDDMCARQMSQIYWYGAERLYVDEMLPTKVLKKDFIEKVTVILVKVLNGFRFQLNQLSWMIQETKAKAYEKVDKMLYNVGYNEWVDDDDALNRHYENANFDDVDAETQRLNNMKFNKELQWNNLFKQNGKINFTISIMTVNAQYHADKNYFFLPLGILQPTLFSINYPLSVQYGAVGWIVGHEMTHGFGGEGLNHDAGGNYNPWFDKTSMVAFNKMTKCVIDQYTKFPYHKNGEITQSEDLADNGGLRAAWNAFQAEQALHGTQSRLPHPQLKKFTHEQLFFIGMTHTWCDQEQPSPPWSSHSPSLYRVMGPLQNFPAFQGSYNCPTSSIYAPKKHCDVWASEVKI